MKESGYVAWVDIWFDRWLTITRMYFDSCGGCDHEVWIENVCMYCNRGCLFCVSGFYSITYSKLSLVFILHLVYCLFNA